MLSNTYMAVKRYLLSDINMGLATPFYHLLGETLRLWWFCKGLMSRCLSSNRSQGKSLGHMWWYGMPPEFKDNLKSFVGRWSGAKTFSLILYFR